MGSLQEAPEGPQGYYTYEGILMTYNTCAWCVRYGSISLRDVNNHWIDYSLIIFALFQDYRI